ncbi:hypothetical protein BDR05DRAFT_961252 [Suillus weaverae]|nr:hypothetical protein BDR05DRAFT_961252 [Suillus weaverae]
MKFIDNRDNNPLDQPQLMAELTNVGPAASLATEVYKLYNCILSTYADPRVSYQHLSIVAALADPLPMSQISELLGPGQGSDIEKHWCSYGLS